MAYKVFQWASGTVGCHAARAVLARESLELVGMHVYSPDKVGADVGTIVGCDATGVAATNCVDLVVMSDADVVIHAPLPSKVYGEDPDRDLDDICALLAAGKNVVTVVGYMYPNAHGPELVRRLHDACNAGDSSFHSTGLNPGWMGDLIPLTMSALSRTIERVEVREISSFEFYPSPEIMFDSMGFNALPDDFERQGARRADWLDGLFSESVQMVADGMNLGVVDVERTREIAIASEDFETASGTVREGRVAGQHWRWSGRDADGRERMVHETVWRMHHAVAPEWPEGNHSIVFDGVPSMRMEFPPDYGVSDGLLGTAMHAVNAIPYVVDAPPGVQTFLDLPWITCRQ